MDRETLIRDLRSACEGDPAVLAAFLGGSDATGRADGMSDIDLVLVSEDGAAEHALGVVRGVLDRLGPLELNFRLPEPTWHGMAQSFYRAPGAPEWLMVDVCVAERSKPCELNERERHGEPVILFDPLGLIRVTPLDRERHRRTVARAVTTARHKIALAGPLVRKALRRGHVGEAVSHYHSLVLAPVVTLVRAAHCPERHDFGLRYLDRDVPAEVRARLERLAMPAGADALRDATTECEAWAAELGAAP